MVRVTNIRGPCSEVEIMNDTVLGGLEGPFTGDTYEHGMASGELKKSATGNTEESLMSIRVYNLSG